MNPASPNPTTSIATSLTSPLAGTQADNQRDRVCPTAGPPVSAGELDRPSAGRVSRSCSSSCLVATVGWVRQGDQAVPGPALDPADGGSLLERSDGAALTHYTVSSTTGLAPVWAP